MTYRHILSGSALLLIALPVFAISHARRGPTSHKFAGKHSTHSPHLAKPASQRGIDDGRAAEIQTALIGAGYLSGEASGHWDAETTAAMQKYQADNGWQSKLIPDSRAIIKLGLGPGHAEAGNHASVSGPEQDLFPAGQGQQ